MQKVDKLNNFDGIRLFASFQVLIIHSVEHLQIGYSDIRLVLMSILQFFPGVPIFFTISGFLILWSYERNKDQLAKFYYNRILRIYPALWICLILTMLVLLFFNVINSKQLLSRDILCWFLAQASVFQFYTPDVLRNFGVGTPNGSLWTISLELQFYAILPILYYSFFGYKKKLFQYIVLISVIVASISAYLWVQTWPQNELHYKLMSVFVLPYLYNFIFGIILYKYWVYFKKIIEGKGWYWLCLYLLYSFIFSYWLHLYKPEYWPNLMGLIANMILAITVISFAFTNKSVSNNLLKGKDFSYGIYIYHMLVVNIFVQLGCLGSYDYLFYTLTITILLAVCSWLFVERIALKWK